MADNEHARNVASAQIAAAQSVSTSTQTLYTNLWKQWRQYCSTNALGVWTATPSDLTGYLQSVYDRRQSIAVVWQHLAAVAYHYRLQRLPSPSDNAYVTMFMKGLRRHQLTLPAVTRRAKPMTLDVLKKLSDFANDGHRTLRQLRTIWRIHLAFYCLLRWDDVCRLKVNDFHLVNDDGTACFEFKLVGGKQVMADPNPIRRLYARPGSPNCPLQLTLKYFNFLGDHRGSVIPTCDPGNRNKPHPTKVLTYSNAGNDLHYVLQLVGVDPTGYSEHSMKRGGATEAARRGASREEVQRAGHWTCPRTADRYIEASFQHQRVFNQYLP